MACIICFDIAPLKTGRPRESPNRHQPKKSPSSSVGATLMVARGRGVLPVHLAHRKEQGHAPIPGGRPSRSPLRIIRPPASLHDLDAYWETLLAIPATPQ